MKGKKVGKWSSPTDTSFRFHVLQNTRFCGKQGGSLPPPPILQHTHTCGEEGAPALCRWQCSACVPSCFLDLAGSTDGHLAGSTASLCVCVCVSCVWWLAWLVVQTIILQVAMQVCVCCVWWLAWLAAQAVILQVAVRVCVCCLCWLASLCICASVHLKKRSPCVCLYAS